MSLSMYGKEFPTYDDICHYKYTHREKTSKGWKYYYDTVTGNSARAAMKKANKKVKSLGKDTTDLNDRVNHELNRYKDAKKTYNAIMNGHADPNGNKKFQAKLQKNGLTEYEQRLKTASVNARKKVDNKRAAELEAIRARNNYYNNTVPGRIIKAIKQLGRKKVKFQSFTNSDANKAMIDQVVKAYALAQNRTENLQKKAVTPRTPLTPVNQKQTRKRTVQYVSGGNNVATTSDHYAATRPRVRKVNYVSGGGNIKVRRSKKDELRNVWKRISDF